MLMFYLSMLDNEDEKFAFEVIYEECKLPCLHVALKITKNQALAEDAVHNAFISLIENKDKYFQLSRCKLKSLIVIITKNKAIDLLRGEKHQASTPIEDITDDILADSFDLSEYVESNESYKHLVSCVSGLPEKYRVIFQLRYMHDLSNKEIAEHLGETQQIVAMQLHRAKKLLRDSLIKEGDFVG